MNKKSLFIGIAIIVLLIIVALGVYGTRLREEEGREEGMVEGTKALSGTVTMSGAWAMYPMVIKWGEEFSKIHPSVKFDISAGGAGKGIVDVLAGAVDIGNVSREIYPAEIEKGAYWISVTKDAVVPVINQENPILDELLIFGVKKQILSDLWIEEKIIDWKEIVPLEKEIAEPLPISLYTRSDACGAAKTWAKYLGGKQEDLQGVGVYGDPGLAEAVRKDKLGIGYNNINYAYDSETKAPVEGLRIVPLDFNENGKIDPEENFYDSREQVMEAIAKGIYPSPPARDLNFVTKGEPVGLVKKFIYWVLTDGQQFVAESGFVELPQGRIKKELEKLE